jgi:hypothetical protein
MEEPPKFFLPADDGVPWLADALLSRPAPHGTKGGASRPTAVQRVCRMDFSNILAT